MLKRPNGLILWRGISLLDNRTPIFVAVTGIYRRSENSKTGDMLQTWIQRDDMHPWHAVKLGLDAAICGDCKHIGDPESGAPRTCYVTPHGPGSVWRSRIGAPHPATGSPQATYPMANDEHLALLTGRAIRFGAYGDPAAVPTTLWATLAKHAARWTGYTHQWRSRPDLKPYLMASVDTPAEWADAVESGWRTFRVKRAAAPRLPNEIQCPATFSETGKRFRQCADCAACMGAPPRPGHANGAGVVIDVHGINAGGF